MTNPRRIVLHLAVAVLFAGPSAALAQTDSAPTGVRWWKESYIHLKDEEGEQRGRIVEMTATTVTQISDGQRVEYRLADVERIEVKGDPVGDGAAAGAAVSLGLLCLAACGDGFFSSPDGLGYAIGTPLNYGLLGAGVDALFKGRTTIYPTPAKGANAGLEYRGLFNEGTVRVVGSRVDRRGRLADVTPEAVTLLVDGQPVRFQLSDVERVAVRKDSIWNGALIGAIYGAATTGIALAGHQRHNNSGSHLNSPDAAAILMVMAGYHALLGAGVDALRHGSTTIYGRERGWSRSRTVVRPAVALLGRSGLRASVRPAIGLRVSF